MSNLNTGLVWELQTIQIRALKSSFALYCTKTEVCILAVQLHCVMEISALESFAVRTEQAAQYIY
jgi:hypothetical protein